MPIAGRGPHGERAAPAGQLVISETDAETARRHRFTVAVVLHTTTSDWARQQLAGIVSSLERFAASVVEVVDCQFSAAAQVSALARLTREPPDAVISLPVGNNAMAQAYREAAQAGIKLILLDNAPTGLLPGIDYASVVSADNFGLGEVGARLLSPHIAPGGKVGIISYKLDFFATNEREIAFRKWIGNERPDIALKSMKFSDVGLVGAILGEFLDANPDLAGLFAVWDAPAIEAMATLGARSQELPMTTIDLGNKVATSLAGRGVIKGIGAQQPYDQGKAVGLATIAALLGQPLPPWVVLPGLAVTPENVVEAYQMVWHAAPPPDLISARSSASRRTGEFDERLIAGQAAAGELG